MSHIESKYPRYSQEWLNDTGLELDEEFEAEEAIRLSSVHESRELNPPTQL